MRALVGDAPREEVARRIAAWRLEPTERRLNRVAEQAKGIARRLNKGELDIEVAHCDSRLEPRRWASFWSAFVHVIRNAVDHGIESPADRTAAGKSPNGKLRLSTQETDGRFIVQIEDDGRGVDWERIAQKAQERGMSAENRSDLIEALFSDGITTAECVSHFSGRGVGMGALRAAAVSRNGTIKVQSTAGTGTTIVFEFPSEEMAEDVVGKLTRSAA